MSKTELSSPTSAPPGSAFLAARMADPAGSTESGTASGFLSEGAGGFKSILNVLNPLHHIPVIGSMYRALTGDTISTGERIAGGALYGGPLGLATAVIASAADEHGAAEANGAKPQMAAMPRSPGEEGGGSPFIPWELTVDRQMASAAVPHGSD
jgi:hypothetical protein